MFGKWYRQAPRFLNLVPGMAFSSRQFVVRLNNQSWPKDGRPVSIKRLLPELRKSLVKAAVRAAGW
jgi:hypothetical protein